MAEADRQQAKAELRGFRKVRVADKRKQRSTASGRSRSATCGRRLAVHAQRQGARLRGPLSSAARADPSGPSGRTSGRGGSRPSSTGPRAARPSRSPQTTPARPWRWARCSATARSRRPSGGATGTTRASEARAGARQRHERGRRRRGLDRPASVTRTPRCSRAGGPRPERPDPRRLRLDADQSATDINKGHGRQPDHLQAALQRLHGELARLVEGDPEQLHALLVPRRGEHAVGRRPALHQRARDGLAVARVALRHVAQEARAEGDVAVLVARHVVEALDEARQRAPGPRCSR